MPVNFFMPQVIRDDDDEDEQQPGAFELFQRLGELPPLPEQPAQPVEASSQLLQGITDASRTAAQQLAPQRQPQQQESQQLPQRDPPDEDQSVMDLMGRGLKQSKEMIAAGIGSILEQTGGLGAIGTKNDLARVQNARLQARMLGRGNPEESERIYGELASEDFTEGNYARAVQQYGMEMRQQAGERLIELGQEANPEGFIENAAYLSAQSAGFVALGSVGAAFGGLGGAFATTYPVMKGLLQNDLEEEGLGKKEADFWSSAGAIPMTAAESLFEAGAVGRLARKVGGERAIAPGLRRGLAKRIAQWVRETGTGTIVEGLTEGLQESMQIGLTAHLTEEEIDWDQARARVWEGVKGGMTVGSVYGAGFGFAGEAAQSRQERIATAEAEKIRSYARNFDPSTVEPGTEVVGKRAESGPGGRIVWRDPETNKFTKAPTREEIETHFLGEETAERMEARAEEATQDVEAIEVPVSDAAERLAGLSKSDRDPAVVGLNIRELASGYIGVAKRQVRERSPAEIKREIAELEALALDPATDTDFATRVTAMARREALINESRRSDPNAVTMLDTTVAARELARLDGNTFAMTAADWEQSGDELSMRILREARALRETQGEREASQSNAVLRHIRQAEARSSRGLAPESRVIREDGTPGTVVNVRKSGFPEVVWDGQETAETVNPDRVSIMPQPGQMVEVTSGEVLQVQQVTEDEVRVTLPDGSDTTIRLNEIERISGDEAVQKDMETKREAQQLEGGAVNSDPRTPVVTPTQAVHAFTGQRVQVASVGAESIELTDGTVVSRDDITFGADMSSTEAIRQTGQIPVFEPGTQPGNPQITESVESLNHMNVNKEFADMTRRELVRLRERAEQNLETAENLVVDDSELGDKGNFEAVKQSNISGAQADLDLINRVIRKKQQTGDRHINFLQVPENYVPILEAAARSKDPNLLGQVLHDLSGTGASLHLLPQPTRPGTRLYAVELPGDARDLTDASKRLLGALSGNVSMDKIKPATLMSRVHTNRPLQGDEMRLMRVPEGVRSAVLQPSAISKMDADGAQAYLRRLTDLSFEMEPAVAEKLTEASQAAHTARDAQIEGNPGAAEVAEIQSKVARAEATVEATRSEVASKLEVWDAIVEELNAGLTPRERSLLDALNGSTQQDLESLPGVGPAIAAEISAKANNAELNHLEDLLEVPRLGQVTYDKIVNAFESGAWNPTAPISDAREQRLKQLLDDLPGRSGQNVSNWVLAYEHPQIPGMVMTIDKENISTPVEVQGRRFEGERAIYHITFVTPDGTQVRARTIGTDEREIRVPKHLAHARGGRATPPAIEAINEGMENGVAFDDIVEQLRSRRREIREVQIGEDTFEVIDDDGQTAMVEGPDGETFQLPSEQVQQDATTSPEAMPTIRVPIRMTPDQVLSEVLRETRQFKTKAKIVATGEWRAQAPGVYAQVRPSREGYQVAVLQESYEANLRKPQLSEVRTLKNFETQAEAEAWLRENGYQRPQSIMAKAEVFQSLPPVEEIPQSLPEPAEGETLDDQQWDMGRVDRELTDILEFYASKGFVPQPVRDYAVRFALRYNQVVQDPVFTEKARRAVNIFTARDAARAAGRGKKDFGGQVTNRSRDFVLEHGNVVVNRKTQGQRGDNTRVLDGILLDPYVEGSHPAKMQAAVALYENHEQNQRFMDMADVDGDVSIRSLQERLVEVGPERRLGIILDSQLGKETVKVQIFAGGEASVTTVKKGDITRIRDPRKLLNYQRAARDSMGELTNLPKTPEMGASPIDQKFGLDLVQDRAAYIQGLRDRIGGMLEHVEVDSDGNLTVTDDEVLSNLADAWIRMKELGIPNRVRHPELENIQSNFEKKYGNAVMRGQVGSTIDDNTALIPPRLIAQDGKSVGGFNTMGVIMDLAYDRVSGQFSNISPYGDVMAKAKLGLLTKNQENQINKQADKFGIDDALPTYRKVEELMQNVWDPNTAHMLYQMRRDVGAVGFLQDALKTGQLKHGLEIRMPAMGSTIQMNWFTRNIMTPREAGYRHPTARVFHYLSEKYRTRHGNDVKRYADIIMGLQGMEKMTKERKEAIWSLLQDEELGDWMRSPTHIPTEQEVMDHASNKATKPLSGSWNWYQQYRRMRELAVELRSENIRNALVRGFHAQEIDFEDASPEGIGERIGALKIDGTLSKEEATRVQDLALQGERVYQLDRTSNAAYARPRDEVEAFIELIEEYGSLERVPDNVRSDMSEWMVKEYDFWARYGINNYAPKIVQGRHAIKQVMEDGSEVLRAFAPDGQTAQEFFMRVQQGEVDGVPHDAKLVMELRKGTADDLDMQFLGSKRFATFYAKMAQKHGGEEGAALARTATRELRLGREPAAPRDLHTQSRISDLSDIIEDPYERMLIYAARTSRNNFLLNIEHAYETARGLDPSLSRAHGVDAIYKDERFRESGHEVMQSYLQELRDSYMGKAGKWEKAFNVLIGFVDTVATMPERQVNRFLGKIGVENYSLWNDPTFVETLYNNDYSARRWAEHLTSVQSLLRLGLNFGGSAINATQHFAFGPSYYMSQGASAVDAHKYMAQGYRDMLSTWKHKTDPENPTAMETFLRDVGVATVPARGVAGPGLGVTGQGKPINFEGKSVISHGMDLVNYYAMMPFSKAETSVRASTALAARRMALEQGMSRDAAIQFARDAVDNTQFQYYDQALPPFMRGSVARVLFQFQQFPLNALKYEKDLMLATFGKGRGRYKNMSKAQAAKSWAMFNATGLTLGGVSWLASRPLLSGILGWLTWNFTKTFGDDEPVDMQTLIANTELFGQGGAEWREDKYPGTLVGNPELGRARDFVLYGAPGLLGFNISTRLGVSGLDIDPTRATELLFGPTAALHADSWNALLGEEGFKNIRPGTTFMGSTAGAIAGLVAGRNLTAATLGALMSTAAITEVLSQRDKPGTDFQYWVNNEDAGRNFLRAVLPNVVEGSQFTYDVFNDNHVYDANLQRSEYPGQMNKLFESAARITGFQTIRSSEQRALLQWRYQKQTRDRQRRSQFATMMARAAVAGNREAVNAIAAQARNQGVEINDEDIKRMREWLRTGPEGKVAQGATNWLLYGRLNPSGGP